MLKPLLLFIFICMPQWAVTATLTGSLVYEGPIPNLPLIMMSGDKSCHKGPVASEKLVLGPNRQLANVLVYIKSGFPKTSFPIPSKPVTLSQVGCMYRPHVIALQVGQTLRITNPDGTLHNVHMMPSRNPQLNIAMPGAVKSTTKVFQNEDIMFPVKCDVHPWMEGYISVVAHPFFQVTGKSGHYELSNLPAGTYELEAVHEKLGRQTIRVRVGNTDHKTVNFTFSISRLGK